MLPKLQVRSILLNYKLSPKVLPDDETIDSTPRHGGTGSSEHHATYFDRRSANVSQMPKKPYRSSDVEQNTMTIRPIYADTSSAGARPTPQIVREVLAETTPSGSPRIGTGIPRTSSTLGQTLSPHDSPGFHRSQTSLTPQVNNASSASFPRSQSTPGASKGAGDFRSIVNVYDQPRSVDMANVYNPRSGARVGKMDTIKETGKSVEALDASENRAYEQPLPRYTNIDDVTLSHARTPEPFYHTLDSLPRKSGTKDSGENCNAAPLKSPPWRNVSARKTPTVSQTSSPARHSNIKDLPDSLPSVSALKARIYENNTAETNPSRCNKSLSALVATKLMVHAKSPANSTPASPRLQRTPLELSSRKEDYFLPGSCSYPYHAKAMNPIQVLDDVVTNEYPRSSGPDGGHVIMSPAPVPVPPPLPPPGTPPTTAKMHVKRMNWEKISAPDYNTVWAKVDHTTADLADIMKYLELEEQFSTRKSTLSESFRDRKSEKYILNPKKAYNISIILGHLRVPVAEFKKALLAVDEKLLSSELLTQLLAYAPDAREMEKYHAYRLVHDNIEGLSKPDQFMYELTRIPGYEQRLKAILFKTSFDEKFDEMKQNLQKLKRAAEELQQSYKLAKILELVLAMGNYMNKGSVRVGGAAGFRVSFLQQLDLTKTSDGKASFLHVLADATQAKCPELLSVSDQLPTLSAATRVTESVSSDAMQHEITELRRVGQEISVMMKRVSGERYRMGTEDKFHTVMQHFIATASDQITELYNMHTETVIEIQEMAVYFGEDRNCNAPDEIFNIFVDFIAKFEKAHRQNITTNRPERLRTVRSRQGSYASTLQHLKKKIAAKSEQQI